MTATQPEGLDMATLTDEQIDALAREHRIYVKRGEETIFHSLNTLTKIRAFARDLLAAAPAQSAEPVKIHKLWAHGGCTGINDYLMTDFSIRTLKVSEIKRGQTFPANDGSHETVSRDNPYAASLAAPQPSPTAVVLDDERKLDVSVLARLSAQIFDCPLNPTISKFARSVEANVRAASPQEKE